jgi:hypothetical protein
MNVFDETVEEEFNSLSFTHELTVYDNLPPSFPGEDVIITTMPLEVDPEMVAKYNVRMTKPKKNWAGKRRPMTQYRQAKKDERMVLATMMSWRKQGFRFKHKHWEVEKEYDSDER